MRSPSAFWPLLLVLAGAWILIGSLRVRRELPAENRVEIDVQTGVGSVKIN